MGEELPLSAYQSFLGRLRVDTFLYTFTVELIEGKRELDRAEVLRILQILFEVYQETYEKSASKQETADPGLESYLRNWIERYLSFVYQTGFIEHEYLDIYSSMLAISSGSTWAAHLVRVSDCLMFKLPDEQWLIHALKVCFVVFKRAVEGLEKEKSDSNDGENEKSAESSDFEDAILAGIDKIPWKRIAELMVDHTGIAEQFLLLTMNMFSVERFRNKNGECGVKKHLIES